MNQQIREAVLGTLMQKRAEERSLARRAVLQKIAALDNVGTEIAGAIAAPVSGAALGGLVGAGLGALRGRPGVGAAAGAVTGLAGAHLANIGGLLAALIKRRRTRKEQVEHDSNTHLENFIPGVASYNYAKRLGRVLGGVGETDEQLKAAEGRSTALRSILQKSAGAGSTLKLFSKTPVFREYLSKLINGSVGGGAIGASIGTPVGVLSGLVNSTADEAKGARTSTLLKNIAGGAGIGVAAGAVPFAIGATAVDAPKLLKVIKALRRVRG